LFTFHLFTDVIMDAVLTSFGNVIMTMIVVMAVTNTKVAKITTESAMKQLNLLVKMLNVFPKITNVTARTIVEIAVMKLIAVSTDV